MLGGFRGFPHLFQALLPSLKLRRYRFLPHPAQIITLTHMLHSLIYWQCPKLKIIKWNPKKGCYKRPKRISEVTTKTSLKKQNRICNGVTNLHNAQWRIPSTAINFRTSFFRNTLLRGVKLRAPLLMLSRFCMVWDTVNSRYRRWIPKKLGVSGCSVLYNHIQHYQCKHFIQQQSFFCYSYRE
jgi:hypothetical protein